MRVSVLELRQEWFSDIGQGIPDGMGDHSWTWDIEITYPYSGVDAVEHVGTFRTNAQSRGLWQLMPDGWKQVVGTSEFDMSHIGSTSGVYKYIRRWWQKRS